MTREEIIRMAREAGLALVYSERDEDGWEELGRFAELVAAAEREACAEAAEEYADYQRSFGDEYAELRAMGALEVMDRIRARGNDD